MIASNKLASILSTTVIFVLLIFVLFLMFEVRILYHDHLKLHRLKSYRSELDAIQAQFDTVKEDIDQVGKEYQVYQKNSLNFNNHGGGD